MLSAEMGSGGCGAALKKHTCRPGTALQNRSFLLITKNCGKREHRVYIPVMHVYRNHIILTCKAKPLCPKLILAGNSRVMYIFSFFWSDKVRVRK